MKYGLIGKNLIHSYSKKIHNYFGYEYELMNIKENELEAFFNKKDFKGINVTIPYKKEVLKYVDKIDDKAKEIGSANTIINSNGYLYAYNTDYDGFIFLLEENGINVKDKECLVLGDGGASKAITYALSSKGAKIIYIANRKGIDISDGIINYISYDDIKNLDNTFLIVNCTPVGMFPNIDDCIDIEFKESVNFVVDLIYNPLRTKLLQKANDRNIKTVNGIDMLIYQAMRACELFTNSTIKGKVGLLDKIEDELYQNRNIVLIGMSGCGKTSYGKIIAEKYNIEFIDTDELIEKRTNLKVKDIFNKYGEEYFRDLESEIIKELSLLNNKVISTGGGVIKRYQNISLLKANGYLYFIDTPLNTIINSIKFDGSRPLLNSIDDVTKMYNERIDLYNKYCDEKINL